MATNSKPNGKRGRGRPAKVVKYHKAKRQYFATLQVGGRTEYFYGATEPEALEKYTQRREQLQRPIRGLTDEEADTELLSAGVPEEVVAENPELRRVVKRGTFVVDPKWLDEHPEHPLARIRTNTERARKGMTPIPIVPEDASAEQVGSQALPLRKRLSDCLSCWREWKQADGCTTTYLGDVARSFGRFRKLVGNKLVSELTADDFAQWRLWVLRQSKKRTSVKWLRDQHKHVKTVLGLAENEHPNWGFPDGLTKWLDASKHQARRQKYVPKKENRLPLPVAIFAGVLTACEKWASIDPNKIRAATQRGRARRQRAIERRREGIQFAAIVRLAANCALDNVDCARIPPSAMKLDDPLPHMDFPRRKVQRQVGFAVPRLTPLLPSTISAVRRWLDHEPLSSAPTLFRNSRRNVYTHSDLNETFQRLLAAADITAPWTFKHLRNIAPSVRKTARLPQEVSDVVLGHVCEVSSKFYEGDVGADYLLPLVDFVGEQYFGGEHAARGALPPHI